MSANKNNPNEKAIALSKKENSSLDSDESSGFDMPICNGRDGESKFEQECPNPCHPHRLYSGFFGNLPPVVLNTANQEIMFAHACALMAVISVNDAKMIEDQARFDDEIPRGEPITRNALFAVCKSVHEMKELELTFAITKALYREQAMLMDARCKRTGERKLIMKFPDGTYLGYDSAPELESHLQTLVNRQEVVGSQLDDVLRMLSILKGEFPKKKAGKDAPQKPFLVDVLECENGKKLLRVTLPERPPIFTDCKKVMLVDLEQAIAQNRGISSRDYSKVVRRIARARISWLGSRRRGYLVKEVDLPFSTCLRAVYSEGILRFVSTDFETQCLLGVVRAILPPPRTMMEMCRRAIKELQGTTNGIGDFNKKPKAGKGEVEKPANSVPAPNPSFLDEVVPPKRDIH